MKTKVLHVTNAFPTSATPEYGVFVKEQIESLDDNSFEHQIVFINGRDGGKRAYLDAVSIVRTHLDGVDVIHCHHVYSLFVAILAGAVVRKPVILSFLNDWTYEVKGLPFSWLRSLVCRLAVYASSLTIFKSPIPSAVLGRADVVNLPNGVDEQRFSPLDRRGAKELLGLDLQSNYVIFVSSKNKFRKQKRYDIFSRTLAIVSERRPDLNVKELVMVGVSREDVLPMFCAASVHLLTSDYEGSPNSVKEALCCGTPVVSRRVGNVAEMLESVVGGYVVDSDSEEILADVLIGCIENNADPSAVRCSFLAKGLTKSVIRSRLLGYYNMVLEGTGGRRGRI